jgi:hypothetical protein
MDTARLDALGLKPLAADLAVIGLPPFCRLNW